MWIAIERAIKDLCRVELCGQPGLFPPPECLPLGFDARSADHALQCSRLVTLRGDLRRTGYEHVSDLAGGPGVSAMQFAINYYASSDSGSDGEEDKIFRAYSVSGALFAQGRHVDVIVDKHGYIQFLFDQRA